MTDAEQILENEVALQRPAVRADRSAVRALLEPDFVEIDPTGKAWDLEALLDALAAQTGYVQPEVLDARLAELGPGVQLLTYSDGPTYHSSVWVRAADGAWRMRFHQQTSIASA